MNIIFPVIKDVNMVMLKNKLEVRNRWKYYFKGLLEVRDEKELEKSLTK